MSTELTDKSDKNNRLLVSQFLVELLHKFKLRSHFEVLASSFVHSKPVYQSMHLNRPDH